MTRKFEKVPKQAFVLNEGPNCCITFNKEDKSFEMLAYSGGVIDHFWFGKLIIDLQGMKFEKPKFPVLQDHMTNLKIGFVKKPKSIGNELRFTDEVFTFIDTDESLRFREEASQGFPFEASIGIRPTKMIRLEEGAKAVVNGRKVKGPNMTIWSESKFRETSVVVFGADPNTASKVFVEEDKEEVEVEVVGLKEQPAASEQEESNEGGTMKDLAELKATYPDLVKDLQTELRAAIEAEFKAENDSLKKDNSKLSEKLDTVTTTLSSQAEEIAVLNKKEEKREILAKENELKAQANRIWDAELVESDIPSHLHPKVRTMVRHGKFVADDSLDVEKFTEAVQAEIATWKTDEEDEEVSGLSHRKTKTKTSANAELKWEREMLADSGDEEALKKFDAAHPNL